jgi:hypothetical protein
VSHNRFNNPDKGAVTHAIVHRALWEYLLAVNETPDEVEREKLRREVFERLAVVQIFIVLLSSDIGDLVAKMPWPRWSTRKTGAVLFVNLSRKDQRR